MSSEELKPIRGEDTVFGRLYYESTEYAALEAENARLERLVSHWQSLAVSNRKVADDALAQLAAMQGGMGEVVGWISVEDRLPPPNTKVLAFYTNRAGKGRRVAAERIAKFTVEASEDCLGDDADYDEATDQYYSPEGWYECVDNWDELAYLFINEGKVTHWMPLPAAPALSAQCEGGE